MNKALLGCVYGALIFLALVGVAVALTGCVTHTVTCTWAQDGLSKTCVSRATL